MTPTTKKQLTTALDGVRRILSRAGIFGGREVTQAADYERRIRRLLEPEDASALVAEANAFTAINLPYIDKARVSADRVELEQKAEEARQKTITDNAHAQQAALIQERKDRELARAAAQEIL